MPDAPWHYAENQFLATTIGDITLMGEIFSDHLPRIVAAAAANHVFNDISAETGDLHAPWIAAENHATNAEAGQKSATLAFTDKIDGENRKPNADTNSQFGISVTGVGDVNQDGHADLLIGSQGSRFVGCSNGGAFLYLGSASLAPALAASKSTVLQGPSINMSGCVTTGFGITVASAREHRGGKRFRP